MNRVSDAVKRPLLAMGLTAVAVTAAALALPWWLSLTAAVALLGFLAFRRRFLCAATAVVFLLLSMGWRHWYWLPSLNLAGVTDTLAGVVVDAPTYGDMYTVEVTSSTRLRTGARVMLQCDGDDRPYVGASVSAAVRLRTVERNQTYYVAQGVFVCAFPDDYAMTDLTILPGDETPLAALRLRLRRALLRAPRRVLATQESAIVAALCFGQRDLLSDATAAAFQGSGLSHLLVVSGLHLSLILLAMRRLFGCVGMRFACLATLPMVWLFAWLVGFSPSIIRAAVMGTIWLVGMLCFCRADGLNSLGLAAVLLLADNPYTLWNAGFQLSFAATAGVLLLAPRLIPPPERADPDAAWWLALWRWFRHTVISGGAACACALLFTLPIAAYHYGGLPLTAVVSNVLAVPVGGAVLLLGWIGALCGLVPWMRWLSHGALWLVGMLCRYLAWVAEVCSPDWAWLTISQPWQWMLLSAVCAVVVCAILWRIPWRRVAVTLTALTVLTLAVAVPLTVMPFRVTVVPSDNEAGFVLRQGNHCAVFLTDANELDEVVYTTAPFMPDAVVVGANASAAITDFDRYPTAAVFSTAPFTAEATAVTYCPVGSRVPLWQGCALTVLAEEQWQVHSGADVLWISTDLAALPPDGVGLAVYVGGTPTYVPPTPYAVVCNERYFRLYRPTLTGEEQFIIRRSKTFTPVRGEWRLSL